MLKSLVKTVLLVLALSSLLSACADFKKAGKSIGQSGKRVGIAIGHEARDVAKAVAEETSKVADSIAFEAEKEK